MNLIDLLILQTPPETCKRFARAHYVDKSRRVTTDPDYGQKGHALSKARDIADISARVHSLRKIAGVTQAEVAKRLEVSVGAYQNYEKGSRDIPSSTAIKLCSFFDVNPRWLLLGDGARSKKEHVVLEDSVILVREFVANQRPEVSFQKEASLIVMVFEYMRNHEETNPEFIRTLMERSVKGRDTTTDLGEIRRRL